MDGEVVIQEVQDTSVLDDAALDKALAAPADDADTTGNEDATKQAADAEAKEKADAEAKAKADAGEKPPELTEEEKLAKQKADKEAFIARQKEERDRLEREIQSNAGRIGELRKRASELRAEAKEATDTVEAIEKMDSARQLERQAKDTEDRDAVSRNKQAVTTLYPEIETLVPKMQDIIKGHLVSLGKTEADVAAVLADFAANPYSVPPAILSNLAEAAKARIEADTLKAELAKVKGETEALKKKGDDALRKVAKAADSPSILSGKSAGTKVAADSIADMTPDQIAELSSEQLDALLAAQKEKEKGG